MCSYSGRNFFMYLLALGTMTVAFSTDDKFTNDVTGSRITATTTTASTSAAAPQKTARSSDLDAAATSGKLFNLGSLFGYGSGGSSGSYPTYNRPYYPNTGSGYYPNTGYYPSTGSGYYPNTGSGYYPNTGSGYYPNTGTGYYPNTGSGYYPNTGTGYYPNTGTGYYPNTGSNYYPGGSTSTYYPTTNNLGGNGGYGGYGGNGGLRQYSGYNSDYSGQRNRGYGYYADTDRNGLPQDQRTDSAYDYNRDRDRAYSGYRGYN